MLPDEVDDVTRAALVTGVTGQDGGYLAEALLGAGWSVHGLVRDVVTESVPDGVVVHDGDLADEALFDSLVGEVSPDVVFHLAGMSSVARSWEEPGPTAEVTGAAVARLLAAVRRAGDVRVVLASSAEVFGASTTSPQDETTPLAPSSPYGAAKAFVLHLAQVYRAAGEHVSAAILYNHESPRRPDTFVTRKITAGAADIAAGRSDELRLGNLDAIRDWGWAPDYVDAMIRMSAADTPDDYVVATGVGHTVGEFVGAAFAAAGVEDWERYVVVDPRFFRPVDGPALVGDARRARESLGWAPTVPFEEIIARMVRADLGAAG